MAICIDFAGITVYLMRLHLHQKSFPRFRHLTKLLWKEDRRLPRWLLAGF